MQVQPEQSPVIVKYLHLIHRAYREYTGAFLATIQTAVTW